jgi:hypothetical protein
MPSFFKGHYDISQRGHFYFGQTGHYHFGITPKLSEAAIKEGQQLRFGGEIRLYERQDRLQSVFKISKDLGIYRHQIR